MKSAFSCVKLARITLQLRTPLAIGSGVYEGLAVQAFVRDANGLPVIPASALAGVWQSLLAPEHHAIFGKAAQKGQDESGMSPLQISFAHIHAANDVVMDGRVLLEQPEHAQPSQRILTPLLSGSPLRRDQVRLNQYGVVDAEGKFERSIVPAGHRFTFEITLWHSSAPDLAEQARQAWLALHAALLSPAFRLGGGTRSGLGGVSLHAWREAFFDLRQAADVARFASLSTRLDACPDIFQAASTVPAPMEIPRYAVELEFCDFWRVGQGSTSLGQMAGADADTGKTEADLLPLTQQVVCWSSAGSGSSSGSGSGSNLTASPQQASLQQHVYLPASGIKGALRHRIEYYLHCLLMGSADATAGVSVQSELLTLFGSVADNDTGHAGILLFDDVLLPIVTQGAAKPGHMHSVQSSQVTHITHNRIDHFTQGTRDGALFVEQVLYQTRFRFDVSLHAKLSVLQQQALELALDDLGAGRLALGAASARGHGYLQGSWRFYAGQPQNQTQGARDA